MIHNLVFHVLKGAPGWSHLTVTKIDVAKVLDISYHKRLFMLTDRAYPYTLYIKYAEPKEEYEFRPVYGSTNGSSNGYVLTNNVELTQVITKRYSGEEEVKDEIAQITKKQTQLSNLVKSLQEKMI